MIQESLVAALGDETIDRMLKWGFNLLTVEQAVEQARNEKKAYNIIGRW